MKRNKTLGLIIIVLIAAAVFTFAAYALTETGEDAALGNDSQRLVYAREALKSGLQLNILYGCLELADLYGEEDENVVSRYSETKNLDIVKTELEKKYYGLKSVKGIMFEVPGRYQQDEASIEQVDTNIDNDKLSEVPNWEKLKDKGYRPEDIIAAYEISVKSLINYASAENILETRVMFGANWNEFKKTIGITTPVFQRTMQAMGAAEDASDKLKRLEKRYNIPLQTLKARLTGKTTLEQLDTTLFNDKVEFYKRLEISRQELEKGFYYAERYDTGLDRVMYFWRKYKDWNSVAWELYIQ